MSFSISPSATSSSKFTVYLTNDATLKFSKIYVLLEAFILAYPTFCSRVSLGFGSDVVVSYVDVVRPSNTFSNGLKLVDCRL